MESVHCEWCRTCTKYGIAYIALKTSNNFILFANLCGSQTYIAIFQMESATSMAATPAPVITLDGGDTPVEMANPAEAQLDGNKGYFTIMTSESCTPF